MAISNTDKMKETGNLTDAIEDEQLDPHLAGAVLAIKRYLTPDVYNRIVDSYDSGGVVYTSNFAAGVDSWAQNAGDANLVLSGNNDSILGVDDVLKVLASGSEIALRIARSASAPTGGKAYVLKFDYYAEDGCGINYLGVEIDSSNRARDEVGEFTALRVIEDRWVLSNSIIFMGFGSATITGYTDAVSEVIASLSTGKAIYFKNVTITPLDDYAALSRAETLWALSLAYPSLSIHTAGRGISLQGGAGDGSYSYVSYSEALKMGREFLDMAKAEIDKYVPILDFDEDEESEAFDGGGLGLIAVEMNAPVRTNPRISA